MTLSRLEGQIYVSTKSPIPPSPPRSSHFPAAIGRDALPVARTLSQPLAPPTPLVPPFPATLLGREPSGPGSVSMATRDAGGVAGTCLIQTLLQRSWLRPDHVGPGLRGVRGGRRERSWGESSWLGRDFWGAPQLRSGRRGDQSAERPGTGPRRPHDRRCVQEVAVKGETP